MVKKFRTNRAAAGGQLVPRQTTVGLLRHTLGFWSRWAVHRGPSGTRNCHRDARVREEHVLEGPVTRTGLPLIHLDLEYWKPAWVRPSDDEWRLKQRSLLAGDTWMADGNYHETLDLRLERADTVVVLATPWWLCFMSGVVTRSAKASRHGDARRLR